MILESAVVAPSLGKNYRTSTGLESPLIVGGRFDPLDAPPVEKRDRSTTQTKVLLVGPITNIVGALSARQSPVADLVAVVARLSEDLHRQIVHGNNLVLRGKFEFSFDQLHLQASGGLHRELVDGKMLGRELQGGAKRFAPLFLSLTGKTVNQIEGNIGETGLASSLHAADDLRRSVNSAHQLKMFRLKGLSSDGYPIDSQLLIGEKLL